MPKQTNMGTLSGVSKRCDCILAKRKPPVLWYQVPPWDLELGEGLTQQISAKADCGLAAPQKWGTANYHEQFPCGFWDRIEGWVFPSIKWALWPEVRAAASIKPTESQLDQELNIREQNWEELTQGSQKWGRGWCRYSEFRVITLWFSYCVQCCQEFALDPITTTKSLKHPNWINLKITLVLSNDFQVRQHPS